MQKKTEKKKQMFSINKRTTENKKKEIRFTEGLTIENSRNAKCKVLFIALKNWNPIICLGSFGGKLNL